MAKETETTEKKNTGAQQASAQKKSAGGEGAQKQERPRGRRKGGRRSERPKPEFEQKIISIRRVARVVAGGRRFSFSVTVVIGNRKGSVGVGVGKAGDTALAIEKAVNEAKKNMIAVSVTEGMSIPHEVSAKYCASCVAMRPAPGRGLVAGSAVRNVLQLAGITDVTAKLTSRSSNQLNNARAAMCALAKLRA